MCSDRSEVRTVRTRTVSVSYVQEQDRSSVLVGPIRGTYRTYDGPYLHVKGPKPNYADG
jgi:hypothetical protein